MDDRKLLELAAKAAGLANPQYEQAVAGNWNIYYGDESDPRECWNPLTDDGDALRLAARLELDVMHRVVGGRRVEVLAAGGPLIKHFYEGDIASAIRRAIVMAAAEIGVKRFGAQVAEPAHNEIGDGK